MKKIIHLLCVIAFGFLCANPSFAASKPIPDKAVLKKMINETMESFIKGVKTKSFADFYASCSELWKGETTPAELEKSFHSFITLQPDLSFLKTTSPVFSQKPSINEKGYLSLEGYYPHPKGGKISFELGYAYEYPNWKLAAFHVRANLDLPNLLPPSSEAKKIPSDEILQNLANETTAAFVEAVRTRNFNNFYASIADFWKPQITSKKLKEIFQAFLDQPIDLTFVAQAKPVFSEKPMINSNGFLVLEGYYSGPKGLLRFRLTYLLEYSLWKLVGIKMYI